MEIKNLHSSDDLFIIWVAWLRGDSLVPSMYLPVSWGQLVLPFTELMRKQTKIINVKE